MFLVALRLGTVVGIEPDLMIGKQWLLDCFQKDKPLAPFHTDLKITLSKGLFYTLVMTYINFRDYFFV